MNLASAPKRGILYALYIDRVVYADYIREQLPSEEELTRDLLELHLFDAVKEYRYIKKRASEIEICISDDTVQYDDIYTETIYTVKRGGSGSGSSIRPDIDAAGDGKAEYDRIKVVNYITYDDNDLMTIRNYRLQEVTA